MKRVVSKRSDRINGAIRRLAALYEFGALQADTVPEDFLGCVADDIEHLRAQVADAIKERDEARAAAAGHEYACEVLAAERDRLHAALEPENIAAALYTVDHGDWTRAAAHWRRWSLEKAGRIAAFLRAKVGLS